MPQLWTPEHLGWGKGQAEMVRQDDSTEDDMLYVTYDDYKALEKDRDELLARINKAVEMVANNFMSQEELRRQYGIGFPGNTGVKP
jgi:hypothetical protein